MALNINQFAQSTVQGAPDLQFNGSVLSARVDASQATAIVPGQAVKMYNAAGGTPTVVGLAANTDAVLGVAMFNLKDASYAASAPLEIAMQGSVVWMTAGAAIARGALVEFALATNKVITSAGINTVIGLALDKAAADGDLVRILIKAPF